MKNFFKLNLPPLPDEIIQLVEEFNEKFYDPINYKTKIDAIGRKLYDKKTLDETPHPIWDCVIKDEIQEKCNTLYSKYFDDMPLIVDIIRIASDKNKPRSLYPHVDSTRNVAVITYVALGGDSVETAFYECDLAYYEHVIDECERIADYSKITRIESYVAEKNDWYMMNSATIHSVENITGVRLGLSMQLEDRSITFEDFCNKFYNLYN